MIVIFVIVIKGCWDFCFFNKGEGFKGLWNVIINIDKPFLHRIEYISKYFIEKREKRQTKYPTKCRGFYIISRKKDREKFEIKSKLIFFAMSKLPS